MKKILIMTAISFSAHYTLHGVELIIRNNDTKEHALALYAADTNTYDKDPKAYNKKIYVAAGGTATLSLKNMPSKKIEWTKWIERRSGPFCWDPPCAPGEEYYKTESFTDLFVAPLDLGTSDRAEIVINKEGDLLLNNRPLNGTSLIGWDDYMRRDNFINDAKKQSQ